MLSKDHVVIQMDHIHDVFGVVLLEELEDLQLDSSLVIVLLLVLDDLDCYFDAFLVIEALEGGAERAFP